VTVSATQHAMPLNTKPFHAADVAMPLRAAGAAGGGAAVPLFDVMMRL
jgi:hypothetical protein